MHASSIGSKSVVISDVTLQEYLESKLTMNGFMAVEVLEPVVEPPVVREDPRLLGYLPELIMMQKPTVVLHNPKKVILLRPEGWQSGRLRRS